MDGTVSDVQSCFHNVSDGWSLVLPEEWNKAKLTAARSAGGDESIERRSARVIGASVTPSLFSSRGKRPRKICSAGA